jgi:putative DNA primase/helicase
VGWGRGRYLDLGRALEAGIVTALAETAFEVALRHPATVADHSAYPGVPAAVWMARIWGSRQGFAGVHLGQGGHYPDGGAYDFTRFESRWFRWPGELAAALELIVGACAQADVFAGVLLRSGRSRRAGNALAGRVCWADVDGDWTPERAQAVSQLRASGLTVWQVSSGSGGRHVYVVPGMLLPPDQLEGYNRRLAAFLDADAGWSETKVLRPPGTFNHKPRARGGASVPVGWCP